MGEDSDSDDNEEKVINIDIPTLMLKKIYRILLLSLE